jgi:hypothetical protein
MKDYSVPDETRQTRTFESSAPVFDENEMQEFQNRMQPQAQSQTREINNLEREMMEAKKARREGKERLSEGARRRIEILINMSRMTRDCTIENQSYRLQSLTSKDFREVLVASSEFDGTIQFIFENRKQILARSITVLAGVDFNQFINSNELQMKLDVIEELDHALLTRLFDEYVILAKEVKDKYTLKTDEDVKEVLEDIKK